MNKTVFQTILISVLSALLLMQISLHVSAASTQVNNGVTDSAVVSATYAIKSATILPNTYQPPKTYQPPITYKPPTTFKPPTTIKPPATFKQPTVTIKPPATFKPMTPPAVPIRIDTISDMNGDSKKDAVARLSWERSQGIALWLEADFYAEEMMNKFKSEGIVLGRSKNSIKGEIRAHVFGGLTRLAPWSQVGTMDIESWKKTDWWFDLLGK